MDQRLFLAIFLGVWAAMVLYYICKVLINLVLDVIDKKVQAKIMQRRQQTRKANEAGRIIGFRPINDYERA